MTTLEIIPKTNDLSFFNENEMKVPKKYKSAFIIYSIEKRKFIKQLDPTINSKRATCLIAEEKITKEFLVKLSLENKKCLVCMDEFNENENILRLPCFHFFHKEELLTWFEKKKTCPVCRSNIEELMDK